MNSTPEDKPTQDEIRRGCLEAQAGWDAAEERKRRGSQYERVEVQRCRISGAVGEPRD